MPSVHCIQEIQRFSPTHLADDDAVGRHAQRLVYEHLDGDRALALRVRGAAPERYAAFELTPQVELSLVLDRHDPLLPPEQAGEHTHERRLPGARAARDEDVEATGDCRLQKPEQSGGEGNP